MVEETLQGSRKSQRSEIFGKRSGNGEKMRIDENQSAQKQSSPRRDFKVLRESISPENVLVLAELITLSETKHLISFMGGVAEQIHKRLCTDVIRKNENGYVLSDSYDLVQIVAVFLCEHFGKHIKDFLYVKNGRKITIELHCFRLIQRQIATKCRRRKTDISFEDIVPELEPQAEIREEQDYTKYDEIMEQLNLPEYRITILNCRMAGMSYSKISEIVGRTVNVVRYSFVVIRKKY